MTKVHKQYRVPEHGANTAPNLLLIYFEDGSMMKMNVNSKLPEKVVDSLVHDVAGQRQVSTHEIC